MQMSVCSPVCILNSSLSDTKTLTWPCSKLLVVKHSYLWLIWSDHCDNLFWIQQPYCISTLMLFSVTHDSTFKPWSLFSPLQECNKETFPVLLRFVLNMTEVSILLGISTCSSLLFVIFSFICNFLTLAIA